MRFLFSMLVLGLTASAAQAQLRTFEADITESRWEVNASGSLCEMQHAIPAYGRALFTQQAGKPMEFRLYSDRAMARSTPARLHTAPPSWKQQSEFSPIGNITLQKGRIPLVLHGKQADRLLNELQGGMMPLVVYDDRSANSTQVAVFLSNVNFRTAFQEFHECLAQLPIHQFADINDFSVYFDSESAGLGVTGRRELDKVVDYLKTDPDISRVIITGHTDNRGSQQYNDKLSMRRAEAVKTYLVEQGIDEALIKTKRMGRRQPVASNKDEKGRADNRRASISLQR